MIVPVTVCIVTLPSAAAVDPAADAAAAAAAAEVREWGIEHVRPPSLCHSHRPLLMYVLQVIVRSACTVLGADASAVHPPPPPSSSAVVVSACMYAQTHFT
jgi:hypothetical protein